jgi:hypothetical protein
MLAATLERFNDLTLHTAKLAAAQVEAYKMIRIRKPGNQEVWSEKLWRNILPAFLITFFLDSWLPD